jgi:hypothetical protein
MSRLRGRVARLEARLTPPRVRMIAVPDLADPRPPEAKAGPGETVLIVATGIRRDPEPTVRT